MNRFLFLLSGCVLAILLSAKTSTTSLKADDRTATTDPAEAKTLAQSSPQHLESSMETEARSSLPEQTTLTSHSR